jgi:hypothetical protein
MRHCPASPLYPALALTLAFGPCGPVAVADPAAPAVAPAIPYRVLPPAAQQAVAEPAFLRSVLPASTVAYLRVPSLWGLLGAPKGTLYDRAVGSAPYAEALLAIRAGALDTLIPDLPAESRALAELLLGHLVSPLELAVMGAHGGGAPQAILAATLDLGDVRAVNALLGRVAAQIPQLQVQTPIGADGAGLLLAAGAIPIEIYFEAASRRLYLAPADPTGSGATLARRVAALTPVAANPLAAAEQALDTSAQGLLLWLDPAPLLRILEAGGKAAEVANLRALGISEARYLALGAGASSGKQRIKVLLDMPQIGFRAFLPAIDAQLGLHTAGAPNALAMLGLPGPEDLTKLEASLAGILPADALAAYRQLKAAIPEALGLSLEDLLGAFGDEVLLVSDQAGTYQALRLRDPAAYRRVLDQLVKRFDLHYETRDLLGTRFHHLVIPALPSEGAQTELPPLLARLSSAPTHLFWIEADGYLLLSGLPQTLMDYLYTADRVPVGDWLRQAQGLDPSGALLLATTRGEGIPRLMYDIDLLVLSGLGDLVGRPLDLFALPSAKELALPASGAYSFQISSSSTQLGIELTYETNPIELFLALGGVQSAVAAGVVAAIAIPAYQDYQMRTQVQPGLDLLQGLQAALAEFHAANGRFPTAEEIEAQFGSLPELTGVTIQLEPDTGHLYANFYGFELGDAGELSVTPQPSPTGVLWQCAGGFPDRFDTAALCPQQ